MSPPGPSAAVKILSRVRTYFFSLSTTSPCPSPSSASASLDASLVLDFADDLWFYKSVVSLPSLSVPCLPSLFSSSPDPSTLIAQCMFTKFSPCSQRFLVSSSFSTPPAPDSKLPKPHPAMTLTPYDSLPAPPSIREIYANTFSEYDGIPYGGDYASSVSDRDEDMYWGCMRAGEDEEAYHYCTAPSEWDDEDAHHGYHVASDGEDQEQVSAKKVEVPPSRGFTRWISSEKSVSKTDWYGFTCTLAKGSRAMRVFFTTESPSVSQ